MRIARVLTHEVGSGLKCKPEGTSAMKACKGGQVAAGTKLSAVQQSIGLMYCESCIQLYVMIAVQCTAVMMCQSVELECTRLRTAIGTALRRTIMSKCGEGH